MRILAIDPGTNASGAVLFETESRAVIEAWPEIPNIQLVHDIDRLHRFECEHLAVETMAGSYGTVVGRDVVLTLIWSGRMIQAFGAASATLVTRADVKKHLADNQRANDAAIRQALIDRYPATGGGKIPQIGTKAQPGPLYGMAKHAWAALAVAWTWAEQTDGKAETPIAN